MDKQIPEAINIYVDLLNDISIDSYCPRCHIDIANCRSIRYCDSCGQRLDWDNIRLYINGELYNNEQNK